MTAALSPLIHTNRDVTWATRRSREDGIAIILVLAFIVILTGLVFAFFSRTITERQVASSSLGQSKADVLARSAVDVIVGDFKQEIVAGSSPTPSDYILYIPANNAYMLPQNSGTPSPVTSGSPPPIPNLVRRSIRSDPLASPSPTFPAIHAVTTAASAVNSTTDTSANGRSVSLSRWNSHYLIPRHAAQLSPPSTSLNNTVDATPISPLPPPYGPSPSPDPTGFIPPDWVMVTSNGPKVLIVPNKTTIGRYAYAIYDEGGLLDVNVAGYPSQTNAIQAAFKSSLAFADLSVLPDPIPKKPVGTSQTDQIVGWRNYTSLSVPAGPSPSPSPPSGSFPNYSISSQNANNYWSNILTSTSGFLTVNPNTYPSPVPTNGLARTDQVFTSRQSLLDFRRGMGATAFTQNALQYLTHFSRDINQPSFAPNPDRPKVVKVSQGGNNAAPDARGVTAPPLDDAINVNFLTQRVMSTVTKGRNDLSDLSQGEPLVKRRFALSRLAWITFKGPIASSPGTISADSDIQKIANILRTSHGLSLAFLQQGTKENIQKYFGLTWDSAAGIWKYDFHNGGGAPAAGKKGAIMKLGDIAASGASAHEPDFVELLKASINVGSIGKTAYPGTTYRPTGSLRGLNSIQTFQYNFDSSVDYQIIQVSANIIDQFDLDGYPTVIEFDDANGVVRRFRGVENLPYIYRVRGAAMIAKLAKPDRLGTNAPPLNPPLLDPGVVMFLQLPEIWNPHDVRSSRGVVGMVPTDFRVSATLAPPGATPAAGINIVGGVAGGGLQNSDQTTLTTPAFPFPNGYAGDNILLDSSNSSLWFSAAEDSNGDALFREPTLLYRPGLPTNSGLTAKDPNGGSDNLILTMSALSPYRSNGGLICDPTLTTNTSDPKPDQSYLGFYLGAIPSRWNGTVKNTSTNLLEPKVIGPGQFNVNGGGAGPDAFIAPADLTIALQCKDPNRPGQWLIYDEKYTGIVTASSQIKTDGYTSFSVAPDGSGSPGSVAQAFDPRTSRFAMPTSGIGRPPFSSTNGWTDKANGVLVSARVDNSVGSGPNLYGKSDDVQMYYLSEAGWYPGWGNQTRSIRLGLFTQNRADVKDDSTPQLPEFYADADGVIRRGMAGWIAPSATQPASTAIGLPTATATGNLGRGRPIVLNRPFRTVGELGHVFKGTPWKNLDFFTVETGDNALLDVFCTNDTDDSQIRVAGKVNLNTKQSPVIQAIIAGAYKDENGSVGPFSASDAKQISDQLIARTNSTTTGLGPFVSVAELVGKWTSKQIAPTAISPNDADGRTSYTGFAADLETLPVFSGDNYSKNVQRFREGALRSLAAAGQTRIWNLMIDVVAQAGRYPATAKTLSDFLVEGEQRYWVHIAIDRFTGQIIDKQIEVVNE